MMSSSANYRSFPRSFRHILTQESFVKLATIHQENYSSRKWPPTGEMFIWPKLGQNPSEIDVRIFARIKNLIWDQLLATKAELSRVKLYFRVGAKQEVILYYFVI